MRSTRFLCVALVALLHAPTPALESTELLSLTSDEPRAFGYQVGDLIARSVTVHVPAGLALDETSVPLPGARGRALELRAVRRSSSAERGGRRVQMRLEYQVFLSPSQVRTLEMPGFTLRFDGTPRSQILRVEAWPVTVAPLVPVEVSPRRGLGELLPELTPPPIDLRARRLRLIAYACVLLALLGYLGHVYFGLPWWSRAHRPFAQAWRALRAPPTGHAEPQRRVAFQRVHEALNRTSGEVVFEHGIGRFVFAHPRFAALRPDLEVFFEQSRREFFAQGASADADARWLIDFCRRCRDAERGSA